MEFSRIIVGKGEFHMKKSKFSEQQIMAVLKEAQAGLSVTDLCRRYVVS